MKSKVRPYECNRCKDTGTYCVDTGTGFDDLICDCLAKYNPIGNPLDIGEPLHLAYALRRIWEFFGENPDREGLKKTPERIFKSYGELFSGYKKDPKSVFTEFEEPCDEMVVLKSVEFHSICEHHMLPFFGKAHIAYIPNGKVIGISKLARLLEIFSRRLQIQERITQQVTAAIEEHLQPKGSACCLEAQHFCMTCRGVNKQNSVMVTSSLTGAFKQPEVRQEFYHLIKG